MRLFCSLEGRKSFLGGLRFPTVSGKISDDGLLVGDAEDTIRYALFGAPEVLLQVHATLLRQSQCNAAEGRRLLSAFKEDTGMIHPGYVAVAPCDAENVLVCTGVDRGYLVWKKIALLVEVVV